MGPCGHHVVVVVVVVVVGKRGKKLIHHISYKTIVEMQPSERFQELKKKELCFQCLYPATKKNHDGYRKAKRVI